MNRRRFLTTTVLTSLGAAALAAPAKAFSERSCAVTADPACRELAHHRDVLAQLAGLLAQKGLNEQQRQTVLAAALCPFCGQPLAG